MPTVTTTDTANLFSWQERTLTYDAEGFLIGRRVVFDDGRIAEVTLFDSAVSEIKWTDPANGLESLRRFALETGQLMQKVMTGSDGRTTTLNYHNNVITSREILDPNNTAKFTSQYFTYDSQGVVTSSRVIYDDERIAETTYENGVRARVEVTDQGGRYDWQNSVITFDSETGAKVSLEITYDDGTVATRTDFTGPSGETRTTQDTDDRYAWDQRERFYDAEGNLARQTFVMDDGVSRSTTFDAGVRINETRLDAGDAHQWDSIFLNFDGAGRPSQRTVVFDDGRRAETTFTDGVIATRTIDDVEDAYSWTRSSNTYDSAGRLLTSTQIRDNGVTITSSFADGVAETVLWEDTADTKVWDTREQVMGYNGGLVFEARTFDDGTIRYLDARGLDIVTGGTTGALTEDTNLPLETSGTITLVDGFRGDPSFTPVTLAAGSAGLGQFDLNADGTWTYRADNSNPLVQALKEGETLTDSLTVTSVEGVGAELSVTVTGVNEIPVIDARPSQIAGAVGYAELRNGVVFNGIDAEDRSGEAVSDAGDVNGDGLADIIIGAAEADPNGVVVAGESYVVFGSATGFAAAVDLASLDGSNGFILEGDRGGRRTGWAVSSAGDVNNDGFDDLLIGTFADDSIPSRAYLVYGAANGFDPRQSVAEDLTFVSIYVGVQVGDRFGHSVADAGDVNGDGRDDLLIGAFEPFESSTHPYSNEEGEAWLVSGANVDGIQFNGFHNAFNTILSSVERVQGAQPRDLFGWSVASAGDVNDDGFADIVVGAPGANGFDGEAYVLLGGTGFNGISDVERPGDLNGTNGFAVTGTGTSYLGRSVAGAGDVNGDGIDDVVIASGAGPIHVIYGSATGFAASIDAADLDGTNGFTITGRVRGDIENAFVSSAGDVNGDGIDDILIGASRAADWAGESYVVFGAAGGFGASIDLATLDGTNGFTITLPGQGRALNGYSVSAAGDVNGDGLDDILIGAPRVNGSTGATYVIYGTDTGFAAEFDLNTIGSVIGAETRLTTTGTLMATDVDGDALTWSGDVTGDYGSFAIDATSGAWTFTLDTTTDAYIALAEGETVTQTFTATVTDTNGGTATQDVTIDISGINDAPEVSAALADQNSDEDAPWSSTIPDGTFTDVDGDALTYTAALSDGSALPDWLSFDGTTFTGTPPQEFSGAFDLRVTASDGHVNVDTTFTLTIDAVNDAPVIAAASDTSGAVGYAELRNGVVFNGIDAGDSSSWAVSDAGDVNGDGIDDIIIGATSADPNGVGDAGESYVVFGSATGFDVAFDLGDLNGANGFLLEGPKSGELAGWSLASAGDVNNDGFDDLLIGTNPPSDPFGDAGEPGSAYLIYGAADGFDPSTSLADATRFFAQRPADPFTDPFNPDPQSTALAGDKLGYSVSSAGDFDGDGHADLLIGAYGTNPASLEGDATSNEQGVTYLVSGAAMAGASSLFDVVADSAFRFEGQAAGDWSGWSVASAGDVNDDGFADIVVGAPGANDFDGAAYVLLGGTGFNGFSGAVDPAALTGANGFAVTGTGQTGLSVAGAGDVNGDGIDDVVIASYAGPIQVIYGSATGFAPSISTAALDGINGFTITGRTFDGQNAFISSAGDVNGDGIDDILIGASEAADQAGESYVVFGAAGGFGASIDLATLDGTNGFTITLPGQGRAFNGSSVSAAGDVNGDGLDDILIGAPRVNGGAGATYLIYGTDTGFAAEFDLNTIGSVIGAETRLTTTGTLSATDADGDALTWSGDVTGDYGSFAIDATTGAWTFTLDTTTDAYIALAEGELVTQTFTATVTDTNGGTATQDVTIDIAGINDAPEVAVDAQVNLAATQTVVDLSDFVSDPDGDAFVFNVDPVQTGLLAINGSEITLAAADTIVAPASIEFEVSDGIDTVTGTLDLLLAAATLGDGDGLL